jgi:hypothetical protein
MPAAPSKCLYFTGRQLQNTPPTLPDYILFLISVTLMFRLPIPRNYYVLITAAEFLRSHTHNFASFSLSAHLHAPPQHEKPPADFTI